ncbi:hypothetical protein MKX01_026343 [Papaver californicum]|nr:hypothetical protein MKX01_026343 [Papaver californicum]
MDGVDFCFVSLSYSSFLTYFQLAQKSHKEKFDHLVLGPAAGQGLRDRLQCQDRKALNKDQFSALPQISNSEDTISIVTVFTIYNNSAGEKTSKLVTVGETSYSKMERSLAILDVFINFIKVSMPLSNVVILTDPASDLSVHRNNVNVAFLEMKLEEQSWKQEYNHHYIFTDSDISVVDDLGQIFQEYPKFHLALTFRNNKEQPLNSGFIAVRGTQDGVLRSKYMEASRMLGDQKALAWIVMFHPSFDAKRFTRPQPFMDEIHGASVLFLPCAIYNWIPPEGAGQFHGMPLNVKVVHFKGSRKRLMLESWNFYNSSPSPSIPDMLCLILTSGRTKYGS